MWEECVYNYTELLPLIKEKKVIILGAGHYGSKLCLRLQKDVSIKQIAFCDNNFLKWGTEILGFKVYSVEDAVKHFSDAMFLGVNRTASGGYVTEMISQISMRINKKQIAIIPLSTLYTTTKEQQISNAQEYIQELLSQQRSLEKLNEVREVKSIAFRSKLIGGTGGGPAKVLEIQEKILGYRLGDMKLSYKYRIENGISLSLEYALGSCLGAIEFARLISVDDKNIVYVVHDIFSACGLAISGKNYVLIYHSQGEAAFERKNMGTQFSQEEEDLIKQIECISLQKALYVCFPSEGAEMFFKKTWGEQFIPQYSKGMPLYNCLIQDDLLMNEKVDELQREEEFFTVLSIGQMTYAKGMDKIPEFLNQLSNQMNKAIRWIVVADGVLKENVLGCMKRLSMENKNISYIQFDRLKHSQINYLFLISDAYLMLHRISIFDFSTLEAMYNNLIIMLSDIPGNREYNLHNNIIMISENVDYAQIAKQIQTCDINNREVYEKEFGTKKFRERYTTIIYSMIEKCIGESSK